MTAPIVTETETVTTETTKPEPDTGTDEVAKWKALARKHESAAKANADAAKRLEAIEAEKVKADQTAAEREAAAEQRATEADSRALRLEVAFEKGLTKAQAKRLVGATREELEADADEILVDFPVKSDGRPKGDADLGLKDPAGPADTSPRGLISAGLQANAAKPK